MKKKLIISALIISLISTLVIVSNVEAQEDLNIEDIVIKIVVDFDYPKNINQVKSDYNNDLVPEFDEVLDKFGNDYDNFSFWIEPFETAIYEMGKNQYQAYPKVVISGSNLKSSIDIEDYNILLAVLRIEFNDFLQTNGGTEVVTHIHFTYCACDINEGF